MTESTISRESTVSVRFRLSASEKPLLVTSIVNVLAAPPAVTVGEANVLFTLRCTSSVTVVSVVLLVLLAEFGSSVPFEVTVALFARSVPVSKVESSVTCTTNSGRRPPRARPRWCR